MSANSLLIIAKFSTICPVCKSPIQIGETIRYYPPTSSRKSFARCLPCCKAISEKSRKIANCGRKTRISPQNEKQVVLNTKGKRDEVYAELDAIFDKES